ncbi:hypothetical protein [Streptomyces sp. NPDC093225]|uniref:AMIN-like domain-containing (lipo)protein n=1 Tax=Streptomyces sp. NPDC093225 TaxID=3366034 RepID=UPI00381EC6C3
MPNIRHRRLVATATGAALAIGAGLAVPVTASAAPVRAAGQPAAVTPGFATPLVVNARTGAHCTYDRLVIDVQGTMPTTSVKRVPVLRYDGSGRKVPLPGRYFLEIKLTPAAAHDSAGRNVYKGPKLKRLTLPKLKGIALTGDFEGVVTFGTAFNTYPKYTTKKLHHPERFVLDVQHANVC